MNTMTNTTTRSLDVLGFAVEDGGINADPKSLTLLAHAARDLGVNDLLVGLMVNEFEPEVARVRAFARVSTQVGDLLVAS